MGCHLLVIKLSYSDRMKANEKQNNYSLAIILSLLGGAALFLSLHFLFHAFGLPTGAANWLIDLIMSYNGVDFVGKIISGNGYVFQLVDRITNGTTLIDKLRGRPNESKTFDRIKAEPATFIGLALGLVAGGVIFTLICVYQLTPLRNLVKFTQGLGKVLSCLWQLSTYGGLGNRLGAAIDVLRGAAKNKTDGEKNNNINYALGVLFGLGVGIALAIVLICTNGTALPFLLGAFGAVSSSASASGYIGRMFDFILGDQNIISFFRAKIYSTTTSRERIGTTIGLAIGVTLGIILIAAGAATLPFFGLGTGKLLAGILLLTTCISSGGGLGNRLGHFFDRVGSTEAPQSPEVVAEVRSQTDIVKRLNSNPLAECNVPFSPHPNPLAGCNVPSSPHPNPSPNQGAIGRGAFKERGASKEREVSTESAAHPWDTVLTRDTPDTPPTPIQPRPKHLSLRLVPTNTVTTAAEPSARRPRSASL
jgi:hypothetical protein